MRARGLISERVWYLTFSLFLFGTSRVVSITEYWNSNHLHHYTTNELVDRMRNLKSNASRTDN